MPKLGLAAVAVIGAFASTMDVLAQQVTSVTNSSMVLTRLPPVELKVVID